jgi:hypothetical protein
MLYSLLNILQIGDEAFGDQETLGRIPGNNIVRSNIDLYEGLTSLTLFHEVISRILCLIVPKVNFTHSFVILIIS